jgi:hypothetical protein
MKINKKKIIKVLNKILKDRFLIVLDNKVTLYQDLTPLNFTVNKYVYINEWDNIDECLFGRDDDIFKLNIFHIINLQHLISTNYEELYLKFIINGYICK